MILWSLIQHHRFLLLFVFIRPDSALDMNCSAMDSSINVGVGATVHAGCCGRREFYCQNSQSKGFKRIRTREKKNTSGHAAAHQMNLADFYWFSPVIFSMSCFYM